MAEHSDTGDQECSDYLTAYDRTILLYSLEKNSTIRDILSHHVRQHRAAAQDLYSRDGHCSSLKGELLSNEAGKVTRNIIGDQILEEIATRMGKSLPPPIWIYLINIEIKFITSHLDHLVFSAILPLLCDDIYQYFSIKTFPVYWKAYTNVTKTIQVEENIAVNTAQSLLVMRPSA